MKHFPSPQCASAIRHIDDPTNEHYAEVGAFRALDRAATGGSKAAFLICLPSSP